MKWLLIQSDGEHKGQDGWEPNWFLRECYAIRHAIQRFGHQADIWGARHANFESVPDFERYDAVLVLENYETEWLPDLGRIRKPLKVHWIIDLHWRPYTAYIPISQNCDVILHSTKSLMERYSSHLPVRGKSHLWFPNGVDDRYFHTNYAAKTPTTPLLFIGGAPQARRDAIAFLKHHAGLVHRYGVTGMHYIRDVLDCYIHWNMGVDVDVNYRNFETIGLGRCLLAPDHDELRELGFKHGENCLLWTTLDECVELAKMTSTNPSALLELGARAAVFSKEHTYTNRYANLYHQLRQERLVPEGPAAPGSEP